MQYPRAIHPVEEVVVVEVRGGVVVVVEVEVVVVRVVVVVVLVVVDVLVVEVVVVVVVEVVVVEVVVVVVVVIGFVSSEATKLLKYEGRESQGFGRLSFVM